MTQTWEKVGCSERTTPERNQESTAFKRDREREEREETRTDWAQQTSSENSTVMRISAVYWNIKSMLKQDNKY